MAEEEKNEQQAEEASAEAETPEVEETPEAEAEQAKAEQQPADEAPAEESDEAPAEKAPKGEAAPKGGADEDEEEMTPKRLRKLERSRSAGPAKPPRTAEERATERAERRKRDAAERRNYRRGRRAKRGEPRAGTPPAERRPAARKVRQGVVVSSKTDKTITVRIDVVRRHSVYEKVVRRSSTVHAHDEANDAGEGDIVQLVETRPLSRTKRWRLVEVLEKAK